MQRDDFADFFLRLVVAPEIATPAIGDLSEEAAVRGNLWFWSGVLQTFFSQIWRDISALPLRMLGLALWAWLVLNILNLLIVASASVVTFITMSAGRASALNPPGDWLSELAWPQWAVAALAIILVAILIGWLLARRSHGREFAIIIATTFLFAVLAASSSFAAWILPRSGIGTYVGDLLIPPAWPIWVLTVTARALVPLLVGWLLARRSEGRELAAVVASISVSSVFSCLIHFLLFPKLPVSPLEFVSGCLFLLVGSILFRRKHSERQGGLYAT